MGLCLPVGGHTALLPKEARSRSTLLRIVDMSGALALFTFLLLVARGGHACVFLTVSSLEDRRIELNWSCNETVDWVTLRLAGDTDGFDDSQVLVNVTAKDYPDGYYKTDVVFRPEPFPGGWSYDATTTRNSSGSLCLYWASAERAGETVFKTCLGIRPAWMSQHRSQFRRLTLPDMLIPGTHNSGCDRMELARRKREGRIESFVLTQDESVWNQLVYGVRFLDLRIGHYPETEKNETLRFWINHDLLGVRPLVPVLREVKHFVGSSPDEVVILDFHRFPVGFKRKSSQAVHRQLIDLIGRELGHLVVPRPPDASSLTLDQIWQSKGRLVVSYNDETSVRATPWLWSPVAQKWGNKRIPSDLVRFLDDAFRDLVPPSRLWAAMAELTPTPLDFLNGSSLRSMADSVNRVLSRRFRERKEWAGRANIVATDFFLGNNLIETAIEENLRRGNDNAKRSKSST